MDQATFNQWLAVASILVSLGVDVATGIREIFTIGNLTPEQQDEILDALKDDNARRRAISAAIAGQL